MFFFFLSCLFFCCFVVVSFGFFMNKNFDNDHSFSQLSVHKKVRLALRARVRGPFASCRINLFKFTSSDFVPLETKWACSCGGKGDVVHLLTQTR